jgi:hypothetical protein
MSLKEIVSDIGNFLTGGLSGKIVDAVKDYFPPSMSEAEKAQLEIHIREAAHKEELELLKLQMAAEQQFNERTKDLEGTAGDLKTIPIIGSIIIFLRGAFRPLFSYALAFIDIKVFSGEWIIADDKVLSVFWIANFVVFGFFFGERAVRNVLPLIKEVFIKKIN